MLTGCRHRLRNVRSADIRKKPLDSTKLEDSIDLMAVESLDQAFLVRLLQFASFRQRDRKMSCSVERTWEMLLTSTVILQAGNI